MARYYLHATVADQAAHTESADLSLPVRAGSTLMIEAIPEGGQFYPAGGKSIL